MKELNHEHEPIEENIEEVYDKTPMPICQVPHGSDSEGLAPPKLPDDERFIEAAVLFQLLCDSTRLKILYVLSKGQYCVYDIATIVNMSAPAVSHHLRSLRQLGIIDFERSGKHVFYTLAQNPTAHQVRHMLVDAFEFECM